MFAWWKRFCADRRARKTLTVGFSYVGRVLVEGGTAHYGARRFELQIHDGRIIGFSDRPGPATDLLKENT